MRVFRPFTVAFFAVLTACAGHGKSPNADADGATTAVSASAAPSANASVTATASATADAPVAPYAALEVDPKTFDWSKYPDLATRIGESPHNYFRFLGARFAAAVCKSFGTDIASMPRVYLHGDPHVEQYAVTDLGRGLSDYDDAAVGPQVVDLVRMTTSLILASKQLGVEPGPAVTALFAGYKAGLGGAKMPATMPEFAKTLAAKLSPKRDEFLGFVDKTLEPLDAQTEARARASLQNYLAQKATKDAKFPDSFFSVKKIGAPRLGLGSALAEKYLFRIEGPSPAPEDDVVVEVKHIADLSQVSCVQQIAAGAADQRTAVQKTAHMEKKLLPAVLLPGDEFWVNEWLANYFEVKLKKLSAKDLEALANEAGIDLARRHLEKPPGGAAADKKKLAISPDLEKRVTETSTTLAGDIDKGYARFKSEVVAKSVTAK